MVADALDPCVARSSAAMVLNALTRNEISRGKISATCVMSVWKNGGNYKYMFENFSAQILNTSHESTIKHFIAPNRTKHNMVVVVTVMSEPEIVMFQTWNLIAGPEPNNRLILHYNTIMHIAQWQQRRWDVC